jgi:uncharacterized protein (UPF0212 family)
MLDKFQVNYYEIDLVSTCAICKTSLNQFVDMDNPYFNCPKCGRSFKTVIGFKALNKQEIIKRQINRDFKEGPKM